VPLQCPRWRNAGRRRLAFCVDGIWGVGGSEQDGNGAGRAGRERRRRRLETRRGGGRGKGGVTVGRPRGEACKQSKV
jgi:hypothetical protein